MKKSKIFFRFFYFLCPYWLKGIFAFFLCFLVLGFSFLCHSLRSILLIRLLSYLHNKETGYLMSRLSDDVNAVQGLLADTLVSFVQNCLVFIAGIGATIYLHPRLAFISFSILPFYALSIYGHLSRILCKCISHLFCVYGYSYS